MRTRGLGYPVPDVTGSIYTDQIVLTANVFSLPVSRLVSGFAPPRRWLVLTMLLPLHIAALLGIDDPWTRALLVSHLGIFLLWQPIWRQEHHVTSGMLMLIVCASLGVLLWLNWWLIAFWLGGLFSLVGGKVLSFRTRWLRLFYLSVMLYLLGLLLLRVVPHLFAPDLLTGTMQDLTQYVLPLILLGMMFFPVEEESVNASSQAIDFIYSIMLFLLVITLVLGSFAFMTLGGINYLDALLYTLFSLAALLIVLGLLWNPHFGYSGLQHFFSGYLLNIGTPFDQWLTELSASAEIEQEADRFLNRAMQQLSALPWISGIAWQSTEDHGELGKKSSYLIRLTAGKLQIIFFTRHPVSTSVKLHARLLTQLINRFHEAKRREHTLRQMTRMQAIYETGSRLTHDTKNLLQSIYTLASAGQHASQTGRVQDFQVMLNRQLPELTRRLELTLSKLSAPQKESVSDYGDAAVWWGTLVSRYAGRGIHFAGNIPVPCSIPVAVFENVTENLLENALLKRLVDPGLSVSVSFSAVSHPILTVCDTGMPVPDPIAPRLFKDTVPSETGFGMGLYQAYHWADRHGYTLQLCGNTPGKVCFELTRTHTATIKP